jgi:molecular chaperone DnaK (HSP70)
MSMMPVVEERVKKIVRKELNKRANPGEVVAIGAAAKSFQQRTFSHYLFLCRKAGPRKKSRMRSYITIGHI